MSYRVGYKMQALQSHIELCLGKQIAKQLDVEMGNIELILSPRNMGRGWTSPISGIPPST